MQRYSLLIDADDTLWENNIYFEQAFQQFVEVLDHSHLNPTQVREVLDEIELENIRIHGYGSANFGRTCSSVSAFLPKSPSPSGNSKS